ncbi:MAG TPA: hypothetical protein VMZ91_10840 [Candidatus Paceibacterota bacterium]|nr:hypothetical protein [Candidatus Paceibacterota bacterium]
MIQPNFNLMLWIIFFSLGLKGIGQIILGSIGKEKTTKYGGDDVVAGIFALIIFVIVLII